MKANSKRKLSGVVVKVFVTVVILGAGFALAYFTDSDRGVGYEKSIEVNDTSNEIDINQREYIISTPWPPTEAQKSCNERLAQDRKNPEINPNLPPVYCGATGEYIAYGNGTPYVFNRNIITNSELTDSHARNDEVCISKSLPYKTITTYESWLQEGQEQTFGGLNGTEISCTNSHGVKRIVATIRPYDKKIVVGTGEPFTYSINVPSYENDYYSVPQYSQAEAQSLAASNCQALLAQYNAVDSSAYSQCVNAYLSQYGY